MVALASCGSPGDPRPPSPPVPVAIADLSARQAGHNVLLTFTLPGKTMEGEPLENLPDVEIFRTIGPPGTKLSLAGAQVYTVPGGLVETYLRDGKMRFADPMAASELEKHAGQDAVYMVRTRASKRRASDDSNVVSVRLYPVAETIRDLTAAVTEKAIEMRWSAPAAPPGRALMDLSGYRIYRGERSSEQKDAAVELQLLGVSPTANYRDASFEFGKTYVYSVRSVAQYAMDSVESDDSTLVELTPRDTFAPAPPQNLVVIPVAAAGDVPAHFELSWSISSETDLAGYHVYRVDVGAADTRPQKINRELLLTPVFRDISVAAGRAYSYTVTAVDRVGNESAPSAPAATNQGNGPKEK